MNKEKQVRTINPLNRFKKSSILIHILFHAEKEPFFGSWIKEELENHGYNISYGTLYPWLKRLSHSKLLQVEKRNVNGKLRKYYSITPSGSAHLIQIKSYLKELYNEVMKE